MFDFGSFQNEESKYHHVKNTSFTCFLGRLKIPHVYDFGDFLVNGHFENGYFTSKFLKSQN